MRRRHRAFEERSFPGLLSRAADSVLVRLPVKLHFLPRSAPTEIPFAKGRARARRAGLFRAGKGKKDCNWRVETGRARLAWVAPRRACFEIFAFEKGKRGEEGRCKRSPAETPEKIACRHRHV